MDPAVFMDAARARAAAENPEPPAAEVRTAPNPTERPAGVVAVEFAPIDIDAALKTRGFLAFIENLRDKVDTRNQEEMNRAFHLFEVGKTAARRFEFAMNQQLHDDKKGRLYQEERDAAKAYVEDIAKDPDRLMQLDEDLSKFENFPAEIALKQAELEQLRLGWTPQKHREAQESMAALKVAQAEKERLLADTRSKTFTGVQSFLSRIDLVGFTAKTRHEAAVTALTLELADVNQAIADAEQVLLAPKRIVAIEAAVKSAEDAIMDARRDIFWKNDAAEMVRKRFLERNGEFFSAALESTDITVVQKAIDTFAHDAALAQRGGPDYLNLTAKPEKAKKLQKGLAVQLAQATEHTIAQALKEYPAERLEQGLRKVLKLMEDGIGFDEDPEERKQAAKDFVLRHIEKALKKAQTEHKGTGKSALLEDLIKRLSAEPQATPTPEAARAATAAGGESAATLETRGTGAAGAAAARPTAAETSATGAAVPRAETVTPNGGHEELSEYDRLMAGIPAEAVPAPQSIEGRRGLKEGDSVMWKDRYGGAEKWDIPRKITGFSGTGRRTFALFAEAVDETGNKGVLAELLEKAEPATESASTGTAETAATAETIPPFFKPVTELSDDDLRTVLENTTMNIVVAAFHSMEGEREVTPDLLESVRKTLSPENQARFDRLQGLNLVFSDASILQARKELVGIAEKKGFLSGDREAKREQSESIEGNEEYRQFEALVAITSPAVLQEAGKRLHAITIALASLDCKDETLTALNGALSEVQHAQVESHLSELSKATSDNARAARVEVSHVIQSVAAELSESGAATSSVEEIGSTVVSTELDRAEQELAEVGSKAAERTSTVEQLSTPEKIEEAFMKFSKEAKPSYNEAVFIDIVKDSLPGATVKAVFRPTGAQETYFLPEREGSALKAFIVSVGLEHYLVPNPLQERFETIQGFDVERSATPDSLKSFTPAEVVLNGKRWEVKKRGKIA